ncbi:tyrosine-type recombinase/integrase [Streptomyces sp. CL7]|uniref:tyrosine-type recombinase/integrase n=1 Tax=Streptomyces sp. CL7 TaxID=3096006 RepID=UPI002A750854|nr:tyrosine-type recombinase/integrase [Streptomyces sp. CL7]WPP31433.1 tyrosine-type recombinase/integrase [Streptomyces sp. CL7]
MTATGMPAAGRAADGALERSPRATPATPHRDPRDPWPEHARRLYELLVGLYSADDVLPPLAASWIAHQRSVNTQRSYARGFRAFEEFAREQGTHPMAVKFGLADTFRLYLETAPTWVRVKGGRQGEMARIGKPLSAASRRNALSAASSFFVYLDKVSDDGVKNPFDAVQRPYVDPDYSPTPGYTESEWARFLTVARDEHRVAAYRKRAYALLLVLYTCCLRIDSLLNARVEDLGYDKGHRVLHLEKMKGGGQKKKPIPPVTWNALQEYLDGRTTGWLFCTASGKQLDEPAVWRLLQSLAKRAGLPLRGPHGVKSDAVTHALAKKDARPDKVQRWADHKDSRTTQRYNKRKELLDDSPGYSLGADLAGTLEHSGLREATALISSNALVRDHRPTPAPGWKRPDPPGPVV